MDKQRRAAAWIAGVAFVAALGIRVATEEPDWQRIEDYVNGEANISPALVEARKIVQLGSHERHVDAAEFLIEGGARAHGVNNLELVLSGIHALEARVPNYDNWPSMFMHMDRMKAMAPEIEGFLTGMMLAADEDPVTRSTARYYLASGLARSIDTAPVGRRKGFRDRALELATGLSTGAEDAEFVGKVVHLGGRSSKQTLAAAEEQLIASIRHATVGGTAKGGGVDFDGVEERFADYRGQVLVVNFWASWCGPCIAAMPKLRELAQAMPTDEFELVNVSVDFSLGFARSFLEAEPMPGTHWHSGMGGELARLWQVRSIPVYVLIDEHGRILARADALTDGFLAHVRDTVASAGVQAS